MDFAREFGLRPDIIEKDYALGWVIAGIFNHRALKAEWIFKGGTCLKKCFFETYRFSEDLDFTLTDPDHLQEKFLMDTFIEIADWIYEQSGIEIPPDTFRFEVYQNPRGHLSVQGRIGYRGPLHKRGDLPRVKLDLTNDELLALEPIIREVHHPYSDRPTKGFHIQCYCYEELFAEKVRALAERERPRDLYDVVHLYRYDDMKPDRAVVLNTLEKKCHFKGIMLPTITSLENQPERIELESEWENMLAHQLPILPPFEQFWQELPQIFEWLYGAVPKIVARSYPIGAQIDPTWQPPARGQLWGTKVPLEIIRFAAANYLCVDLAYKGSHRLIEPYSLRRTKDGNLLLHAIRHDDKEHRSYRIDRIEDATLTKTTFVPKYTIELNPTGPISAFADHRAFALSSSRKAIPISPRSHKTSYGPTYVIECPICGKRFTRKTNNTKLNKHKDKQGYPCYSKSGYLVDIKY
ncbi:MAG: nucleotidyl transferase AbiEii/AbiGii toxin family protein [Deltaproteobacteria bacterium]|nr:nucleotidyl transferase AbiEii/AbiGii toxin family protein [Deltaproteobacteria bacterium]